MRIFKYWIKHSAELKIGNTKQLSSVFGGSNNSISEAVKDAERKLDKAQLIISGKAKKDKNYEADIREEIIDTIDANNIITRNRYGVLVLNSKNTMFIDVDDYSRSLMDLLFRRGWSQKKFMLAHIERTLQKSAYSALGFRVYETFKGYRILVLNAEVTPRSSASRQMMKDFGADSLYQELCLKQNCYRARLTPKPYRMGHKGIKVIYPDRSDAQQSELNRWIEAYETKAQHFSTCRLLKSHGRVLSSPVTDYHDRLTGIDRNYKLA